MTDPAPGGMTVEVQEYLKTWAKSLGDVLTLIAGPTFAFECEPSAPPDPAPVAEWLSVTCEGKLAGEMSLRLPQPEALRLAQLFMAEEPSSEVTELSADHREAVQELFRQVAGHVVTALKPTWGEVQLKVNSSAPPSWEGEVSAWLKTTAESTSQFSMQIQVNAALTGALRSSQSAAAAPPAPTAAEATHETPDPASAPAAVVPLEIPDGNYDMLMDVELGVSLRFGGKRMLLRDILELNAGVVVELDRQVQEPVELLLDGKMIARGEVVVVDGNYGLRILEVQSALGAD